MQFREHLRSGRIYPSIQRVCKKCQHRIHVIEMVCVCDRSNHYTLTQSGTSESCLGSQYSPFMLHQNSKIMLTVEGNILIF